MSTSNNGDDHDMKEDTKNDINNDKKETLSDEELRKVLKPFVTSEQVKEILEKSYAGDGEEVEVIRELDSYDDVNFQVKLAGTLYLLKIHNGVESKDFNKVYEASGQDFSKRGYMNSVVHLQSTIMVLLTSNGINTSQPKLAQDTRGPVCVHSLPVVSPKHSPQKLVVRLLGWVEGKLMSSVKILPVESLADAGRFLGKVDKVLDRLCLSSSIQVPGLDPVDRSVLEPAGRYHQWDGKNTADLRSFVHCIADERRRGLVKSIIDAFVAEIIDSGDGAQFRQGVNHGDYNDANILLSDDLLISGVIDFGDSVQSWRVLDVTVAMAYGMLSTYGKANRGISAAAAILRGFNLEYPLTLLEKKHLVLLIACRLACSVTLGAYSFQKNPENKYLLFHAEPAWKTLEMFWCYDPVKRVAVRQAFAKVLDQACLHKGKPDGVIACSDIMIPDPSVVDLLSPVRIVSTPDANGDEPPQKNPKIDHDRGKPVITFVTGNHKKLEELERILTGGESSGETFPFQLTNKRVDLPELQGDPVEIALEKCALAAKEVGGAVMIEDTSLCFNALGGMPGPYIKWFLDSCGLEGLYKLLAGHEDKTAYAQTVVAFSVGPGKPSCVFVGKTTGKIVMPRGRLDFGWDPVFEPDDNAISTTGKTYGEMSQVEKDSISHRSRALAQMSSYFEANKESLMGEIS